MQCPELGAKGGGGEKSYNTDICDSDLLGIYHVYFLLPCW